MTRKRQTRTANPATADTESSEEEVVEEEERPTAAPAPKERRVTFVQWARRRAVKPHHMGGLKAFCPSLNRSRTLKEWDDLFANY
jgi:hypothetical protein